MYHIVFIFYPLIGTYKRPVWAGGAAGEYFVQQEYLFGYCLFHVRKQREYLLEIRPNARVGFW